MSEYYNDLKLFAFPEHVSAFISGEHKSPIHIRLKPTNKCNHNCWFCAYRVDNLPLGEEMNHKDEISWDNMLTLIQDIKEMGVKAVTFSGGGEPLVYPYIYQTIDLLTEAGIKVAILTNGTMLKGKLADLIAERCSWIRVSIDSWSSESHARLRSTSDSDYDTILNNIAEFCSRTTKTVLSINYIVTKDNHDKLFDFCKQMKVRGVSHIKLSACITSPDLDANNEYHSEIFDVATQQIAQAQNELEDNSFHIVNHYHTMKDEFDKSYNQCHFFHFLTVIGADCNVYTCHDKAYTSSGRLGSFKDSSFKEFWFSDENIERMRSINPSKDCKHHCVANGKNMVLANLKSMNQDHKDFV